MGRRISADFKRQAVVAHRASGKSLRQSAKDLGISESALARWLKDPGLKNNSSRAAIEEMDLAEQVGVLKRELKLVTMERDYLARGLDFIARESGLRR